MINPSKPINNKSSDRNLPQNTNHQRTKSGVKKVYSPEDQAGLAEKLNNVPNDIILDHIRLELPPGPVIQVHSPRMRGIVDTFLKNTSTVHTAFRSILQGPAGGFQGDMNNHVLALIEDDVCSAALASSKHNRWLIHSRTDAACHALLDIVLKELMPSHIEGEASIVKKALGHPFFNKSEVVLIKECTHFVLSNIDFPHGPGGLHRLAMTSDIPRLEEYAVVFMKEVGYPPLTDWKTLIEENRIFFGIIEGTPATVAIRSGETLDNILIEGVYTFKPFRRRGLAKKLVAALARQGSGRDLSAMTIVGKENAPMLKLLEVLEFIETADYLKVVLKKTEDTQDSP